MLYRIFAVFIVIVAVAVGLLNISSNSHIDVLRLSLFNEFFIVSLPILAFGALIKYICGCCSWCASSGCTCGGKCSCGSGRCCCGVRETTIPRT